MVEKGTRENLEKAQNKTNREILQFDKAGSFGIQSAFF